MVAQIPHPLPPTSTSDSFSISSATNSNSVQLTMSQDHTISYLEKWDFTNVVKGGNLKVSWPSYTTYDGQDGAIGASFSGNFLFLRMFVSATPQPKATQQITTQHSRRSKPKRTGDSGTMTIYQISLGENLSDSPKIEDSVKFSYQYVHDCVTSDSYLYSDTAPNTISRWQFL